MHAWSRFDVVSSLKSRSGDIEIVGLAKNVKDGRVRSNNSAVVYLSDAQQPTLGSFFYVRTMSDPLALVVPIREATRQVEPNLPLSNVRTRTQLINEGLATERLLARTSAFLAGVALLLACIGLYGILSYSVSRRTGAIGIRMAFGAQRLWVVWLILWEMLLLITVGVVGGVGVSLALTRLIRSRLFGVEPVDPMTIEASVLLMLLVAALAGSIPALRASQLEPMVALRQE